MSSTDPDPSSRSSSSLSVCSHLSAYRSNAAAGISKPFPLLLPCLRPRSSPLGRAEIVREPHELPHCSACAASSSDHPPTISSSSSPRLFACLTCASVLCPTHAPLHHLPSPGHDIAVDVDRAELFCCPCNDQIYDPDFDAAVILSFNVNATSPAISRTKKRRVDYYRPPSAPSSSTTNSSGVDEEAMPARGLRGMNNLGNTCFMSSVLQALLHTPPLRNYFLSDRHNRFACQKGRRKKSGGGNAIAGKLCLACDLDEMYSEVFSGDRIPYSPAKFLYR